ncbi:MAG: LLM class flavin-dependent oxidoreductase [Actinomycetia bacterium]|nr:LLM class flavin-dependent oxidoreductase [Actinomycetes bacterium]
MGDDGIRFGWFIPTAGDTDELLDPTKITPSLDLFLRVARAAEDAGFEYVLVPVQTACWDSYISCAFVAAQTERISMLLAARAGFIEPTVMAKMISTFDQLSGGRVKVNLITGGSMAEMAADGLFADHDERYAMLDEAVTIMKKAWTERRFDFDGDHYRVEGALVLPRPFQDPHPPFYLGGSSAAARRVSINHADVHLFWGDHPDRIAETVAAIEAERVAAGRETRLAYGMRLQIICRDTEAEAWEAAHQLVEGGSDAQRRRVRNLWDQSTAGSRQQDLADADDLHVEGHPHLWAGIARLRPGAGTAIVGNPEQVAATLDEFVDAGCGGFCLSGYPHDTEAQRFGHLVMPYFADRLAPPGTEIHKGV